MFVGASSVAFAKENITVDISNENYVVSQNTSLVASKGINTSAVVFDSSTFSNNTLTTGVNESIYGGIVYLSSEGQITGGEFVNNHDESRWSIDATTGQLVANVTVPEPAEWAMILGALALGMAIYRRRK